MIKKLLRQHVVHTPPSAVKTAPRAQKALGMFGNRAVEALKSSEKLEYLRLIKSIVGENIKPRHWFMKFFLGENRIFNYIQEDKEILKTGIKQHRISIPEDLRKALEANRGLSVDEGKQLLDCLFDSVDEDDKLTKPIEKAQHDDTGSKPSKTKTTSTDKPTPVPSEKLELPKHAELQDKQLEHSSETRVEAEGSSPVDVPEIALDKNLASKIGAQKGAQSQDIQQRPLFERSVTKSLPEELTEMLKGKVVPDGFIEKLQRVHAEKGMTEAIAMILAAKLTPSLAAELEESGISLDFENAEVLPSKLSENPPSAASSEIIPDQREVQEEREEEGVDDFDLQRAPAPKASSKSEALVAEKNPTGVKRSVEPAFSVAELIKKAKVDQEAAAEKAKAEADKRKTAEAEASKRREEGAKRREEIAKLKEAAAAKHREEIEAEAAEKNSGPKVRKEYNQLFREDQEWVSDKSYKEFSDRAGYWSSEHFKFNAGKKYSGYGDVLADPYPTREDDNIASILSYGKSHIENDVRVFVIDEMHNIEIAIQAIKDGRDYSIEQLKAKKMRLQPNESELSVEQEIRDDTDRILALLNAYKEKLEKSSPS